MHVLEICTLNKQLFFKKKKSRKLNIRVLVYLLNFDGVKSPELFITIYYNTSFKKFLLDVKISQKI